MANSEALVGTGRTGGRKASTGVIPGKYALSVGMPSTPAPQGWRWTPLSEVAQLESGHTPSRRHPEYWGGETPWVGLKDAVENHGRTIHDTYQHVTDLGLANSSARLLPADTVCLSRTASVGYVVMLGRPMATSQDFVNWICGPDIDPIFLKYVLIAEKEALWRFASGTTHQTIYYPEAKAFHVCLPSPSEQRSIAQILDDLDKKIELNQRRRTTLETMARALFKDWFVDFGPVRSKAEGREPYLAAELWSMFPSELDESGIPKGWEPSTLGDWVEILDSRRVPLSSKERSARRGPFPYHGATGVMDYVDDYLFDGEYVLLGEDGSVVNEDGKPFIQYVWGKFWVNNHAHVLRGNGVSTGLLRTFLEQCDVAPFVTGAVQAKLSQGNLKRIPFVAGDRGVFDAFDRITQPWFTRLRTSSDESGTLFAIRDSLLPKLLSGELRVGDAERLTQGAAI